jgi:dTDP-4-amino-4,6-dideoxygalactose transaminase
MAEGIYKITENFEKRVAAYTGAPYAVAVDCCTNAIFLSLTYLGVKHQEIMIPSRTYMSVPCTIIQTGNYVVFDKSQNPSLKGEYRLGATPVWDSALRFTSNMYIPGRFQCLSFSGPNKILKLSKGGMILTDDEEAYVWLKKARFSGRNEQPYHTDVFTQLGWNMYLLPELATRGLLLMDGISLYNNDKELPYPDLSQFDIYRTEYPHQAKANEINNERIFIDPRTGDVTIK